jgi:16S rRNA (cytidine1402-2'-O)-methyltransferase
LESIANETGTIIALETPHRLTAALQDIIDVLGDRRLAIGRELTKLHEEVFRGTISEAIKHFIQPRGEFTLVIEGRTTKEKPMVTKNIKSQLKQLQLTGAGAKEAVAAVAMETGLPRKELYKTWLRLGEPEKIKRIHVKTG